MRQFIRGHDGESRVPNGPTTPPDEEDPTEDPSPTREAGSSSEITSDGGALEARSAFHRCQAAYTSEQSLAFSIQRDKIAEVAFKVLNDGLCLLEL